MAGRCFFPKREARGRVLRTEEQKNANKGRTRRCAPTANNNQPQCRGRPMCLPENASKKKKYSSTASGPTGSPSVMIEGVRRSREGVPKRRSLKEKKTQTKGAHAGAPLRQTTTNHNVGADRCVCPKGKARIWKYWNTG